MTADVIAAAASTRAEARRLRHLSQSRRLELLRHSRELARLRARLVRRSERLARTRETGQRSPWSDLPWRYPGRELDRILAPLDGRG